MILNNTKKSSRRNKRSLVTYGQPDSIISDQFRTIRTNVQFLTNESHNRVFLVTSPWKNEGKSAISSNLAVSMAQQKDKVLLIDANLREPILDDIFKIPNELGLTNILEERATHKQAIQSTGIGKLDVLTSGSIVSNPGEVLGNEIMKYLLSELSASYDTVLIDSPSLLKSTETRILANQCSGVILVLERGKTTIDNAEEAGKILDLSQANLIGSIFNTK